jgi:hypothetical protein
MAAEEKLSCIREDIRIREELLITAPFNGLSPIDFVA